MSDSVPSSENGPSTDPFADPSADPSGRSLSASSSGSARPARTTAGREALVRIAFRLLGTREAAEDVVQEALLRHVERFGAGREDDAPDSSRAWLATVTRNLAIDRLRRIRREHEARLGERAEEPGGEPAQPDDELERHESRRRAIDTLLRSGEPRDVAAVLLRETFGTGYADIARGSGRGAPAWRQAVHRALERTRDRVAAEEGGTSVPDRFGDETSAADGVLERFERAVSERNARPLFDALRVNARVGAASTRSAVIGPVLPPFVRRRSRAWTRVEIDAGGVRLSLVLDGRVLCRVPAQRSSTSLAVASAPHQSSAFCA